MADETQVEDAQELETGQPGQAETEQSEAPQNLDDDPRFREWKSKMDSRMSQLARAAEEREREARELREQLQAERLKDADPAERAEILQQELRTLKAQTEAERQAAQRQQELMQKANNLLGKHGIAWDDPRLDKSGGATQEGYETLLASVTDILAERAQQVAKSPVEKRREKAQEQAQKGVAQTSSATGGSSPETRQAFLEARQAFRRGGDLVGYAAWRREQAAKYGEETVAEWLRG
jgi:hypothetical protein